MTKGYDYLAAPLTALRAGNSRLAIQQLEELAVVKPEIIEVQYHLARAYQAAGEDEKARALLAEVANIGDHPFRAHAQAQLVKLGGPAASANTGIVPPHVVAPRSCLRTRPRARRAPRAPRASPRAVTRPRPRRLERARRARRPRAPDPRRERSCG